MKHKGKTLPRPEQRKRPRCCSTLLACALAMVFVTSAAEGEASTRLRAMASLFPLYEFAKSVGGERVQVDLLLPPGAEPHTWEPKASDIAKISAADVFVYLGASLEPHVSDLLKGASGTNIVIVEAARDLPLMAQGEGTARERPHTGEPDPHVWLDLAHDQTIVERIAEAFAQRDPDGASTYRANAQEYRAKLAALDQLYRDGLRNCRQRRFVMGGHAAFSYLARRYGLEQIALYGVNPDAKPTARRMTKVVELAKQHGVKVIYFEALVSDELADVIAKEVGARTLFLNPGHNLTKEDRQAGVTFLSLMEANLRNLREGLGCE